MDKAQIRKLVKSKRSKLSSDEVKDLSQRITDRLIEFMDLVPAKILHTYLTIPRLNEVDTAALIEYLQNQHPHITIYHPEAEPAEIDIIIVPLLGFDKAGNRLGHGGGYYDRFLKKYPQAKKVGLAFELQKIDQLPVESHDVRLDAVVTESKIYNFSN